MWRLARHAVWWLDDMPGSRHRETYSGEEDKGRGVGTPDSWGGGCGDGELRSDGLTWGVGGRTSRRGQRDRLFLISCQDRIRASGPPGGGGQLSTGGAPVSLLSSGRTSALF